MFAMAAGPSITNRPTYEGHSDLYIAEATVHTHSSVPVGTARANRRIYMFIASRADEAGYLSQSVTVNGASATLIALGDSFTTSHIACFYADVPSGTTASVVITFNKLHVFSTISVFSGTTSDRIVDSTAVSVAANSYPSAQFNNPECLPAHLISHACAGSGTIGTWLGGATNLDSFDSGGLYGLSSIVGYEFEIGRYPSFGYSFDSGTFSRVAAILLN